MQIQTRSPTVKNLIALQLLSMLCTPFSEMPACQQGVIDDKGKYLIPSHKRTANQRKTVTYLDRLIINIKKMINKLPGGENKLKNIVSAMVLIKENYNNPKSVITEQQLYDVVDSFSTGERRYQEMIDIWSEYIKNKEMYEQVGVGAIQGAAPTNNTQGISFPSFPISNKIRRRNHIKDYYDNI